ncbi:ParA family protein [Teredinibacter sp. KSP-S5-2]|uniref:ParA family protein n=1 Tax=Teredinibacter sp. KSP-S5-2 TaxID=3034506 RepID=UPI002934ABEB|nr:ParA family protein [Teredinibacter sp. KSP-S5-2]WNO10207.1 ParA family protein [Teredinibacter sp. KSP-S5-2]
MEQVFVANPKGGCGKTTIATHLAGFYSSQGFNVLLVDHDAQRSSSDWLAVRPKGCSPIDLVAASADTPTQTNGADCVVHDMPAAWSLEHVSKILHSGDKVLIPVLSSPTDIKASFRFIMSLHRSGVMESGIDVGLIANRVRTNTNYVQILNEFLERINLPMVSSLRDTQNYVHAMDKGVTIFDFPPSRIKKDREQWQPVLDWLAVDA